MWGLRKAWPTRLLQLAHVCIHEGDARPPIPPPLHHFCVAVPNTALACYATLEEHAPAVLQTEQPAARKQSDSVLHIEFDDRVSESEGGIRRLNQNAESD